MPVSRMPGSKLTAMEWSNHTRTSNERRRANYVQFGDWRSRSVDNVRVADDSTSSLCLHAGHARIPGIRPACLRFRAGSARVRSGAEIVKKALGRVILVFAAASLLAAGQAAPPTSALTWPTKNWPKGTPASVGLDEETLKKFDADIASGKYALTDSFRVFRCGMEVFAGRYQHDYAQIYAKESKTRGPLNAQLTGRYNYFDPEWHPFYQGTDLHTMQSVSKTVTSIIFGVAITRGDFKASLSTPVLKYFDVARVKNVNDWKRHMTIENLLTMTSGMNSEELFYPEDSDAPRTISSTWSPATIGCNTLSMNRSSRNRDG